MQHNTFKRALFAAIVVATASAGYAQNTSNHDVNFTIEEAAMIQVVDVAGGPSTTLPFHIQAPSSAGQAFPGVPSQNLYLQY
ncbi:MAG: hypothetical protein VW420_07960, partial [Schleiferiaceae bacterium]